MNEPAATTDAAPIGRHSVAEQVYRRLKDDILTGRIGLGERVVESRIARRCQTSRAPVREAVQRLTQEGLLETRIHFGPSVISLDRDKISELYEARFAIEARAIDALCRQEGNAAADLLDGHVEAMRAACAAGDAGRLVEGELAFHMDLCRLSGNSYLIRISQMLQDQTRLALMVDNAHYPRLLDVAEEHVQLVTAIRNRDPVNAVRELESHIKSSLAAIR
jgi:DNA-binding GntR family transcriptional regulator